MAGGLDLGTVFELASGIVNSIKREDGKEGVSFDFQNLGLVLGSFAGRQALAQIVERRHRKDAQLEEALEILRERAGIKQPKKQKSALSFVLLGLVIGSGVFIGLMKPEQRAQLFKNVDKLIGDSINLANEFKGRS